MSQAPESTTPRRPIRWWPLVLIALALVLALLYIWLVQVWVRGEQVLSRQHQVIGTMGCGLIASLLVLLWAVFLSRFPRRWRWTVLGVAVAFGIAVPLVVRIRGVTGDLIPILAFRWTPEVSGPAGETLLPGAALLRREIGPLDFPQFLGPERRGVIRSVGSGVRLARDWATSPPRLLWKQPMGPGWSSFAVVGNQVFTQEQRGDEEVVVCRELASGEARWLHADKARYDTVVGGIGPRATPTVTEDCVFTLGGTGILNSLDRASGKRLWSHNVVTDHGAKLPSWGKSCSPLVLGELVVVSAGGPGGKSLVAYDAESGDLVWAGGDAESGYSSPALATLAEKSQILIFNKRSVASHDPLSGSLLWTFPWTDHHPNVAQPLALSGDRVLVSTGYGVGCKLLKIESDAGGKLSARLVWKARTLKAKFANFVARGEFVYGLDDGILVCVDLETGKRRWKRGRYGHGQMLLVEDVLLVTTDKGEVVLVDPSPEEFKELTRFRALDGRTWASPALSGRHLLVRSDEEAACYELPVVPKE